MSLLVLAAVTALAPRPDALVGTEGQEAYAAWLGQAAVETDRRWAGDTCAEAEAASDWPVTPAPASFAAAPGFSDVGEEPVLHERVRLTGCGRTRVVNLLTYRLKAGGWRSFGLLPGEGRADPARQMQAFASVIRGVETFTPGCSGAQLQTTLRSGPVEVTRAPDEAGSWQETWPVEACGQARPVRVTFQREAGTDGGFAVTPLFTPPPAAAAGLRP